MAKIDDIEFTISDNEYEILKKKGKITTETKEEYEIKVVKDMLTRYTTKPLSVQS